MVRSVRCAHANPGIADRRVADGMWTAFGAELDAAAIGTADE
jgi:hypothetical protein